MTESDILAVMARHCPRAPAQWNRLQGSDAELIPVGAEVVGLTADLLVEEIELGIFRDPELLGWVSVVMSLSDLAAAGCEPCGVLNLLTVPEDHSPAWVEAFFGGVGACCAAHRTAVVGGDTNFGALRAGSSALGRARHKSPNPRLQALPGHDLYVAGACGHGNRLAYAQITGHSLAASFTGAFRPPVDYRLGSLALELGGTCIDTSDGLVPTLATLLGAQPVAAGAELDAPPDDVADFAARVGLPSLAFLLGEVGDYGLLLTVPPERRDEFVERARGFAGPAPARRIGGVIAEPAIVVQGPCAYRWTLPALLASRGGHGDGASRLACTLKWLDAAHRA